MTRLFVDTSAWYAYLVAADKHHKAVRRLLESPMALATSNMIFSELSTLLMARGDESVALPFGDTLRDGQLCNMVRVAEEDEVYAWHILHDRRGRGLSYVDATVVAIMRRLRLTTIATFDDGFREFGVTLLPTTS